MISLKRKFPKIEKIKKNNNSKAATLNKNGREYIEVLIKFCKPSNFFINLNSLETLKTLKTFAICGPTAKKVKKEFPKISNTISKIDEQTTNISNLFQST